MKGIRIDLNSIKMIEIPNELKALQEEVGGYIETLTLRHGAVMIVNEEGLLKNYPLNDTASLAANCMIHGTALIFGYEDDMMTDVPAYYLPLLLFHR